VIDLRTRSQLPLARGAAGESVRDLQRRLAAIGFEVVDPFGDFGDRTEVAVRLFQESRGLRSDGICGAQTWDALVEAGWRLGDRFLYLRSPMLRGDDVVQLQQRLGRLGFDAGRVDGIFGARTGQALTEFQRNAGLGADGICGPETVAAILRLGARNGGAPTVAAVREEERLRAAPRQLAGRRVVVADAGGFAGLADAVGRALGGAGAVVAVLHDPDESRQAAAANEFAADVVLGLRPVLEPACRMAYYEVEGFSSIGGSNLARTLVGELEPVLEGPAHVRGMRLALLRETRMPAVLCELGPPTVVVQHLSAVADAIARACGRWARAPVG
jgi:N-acetylmuramoyl-L-alanine amidase